VRVAACCSTWMILHAFMQLKGGDRHVPWQRIIHMLRYVRGTLRIYIHHVDNRQLQFWGRERSK
jgi:hypothetical protein